MHYWADLQSVQRFHCYDNIAPNAKYQRVLVLALRLVFQTSVVILNVMSVSTCCLLHLATTADTGVTGSSRDSTYKIGKRKQSLPFSVSVSLAIFSAVYLENRLPAGFVTRQESTTLDIVCSSPQAHKSELACCYLFRQVQ